MHHAAAGNRLVRKSGACACACAGVSCHVTKKCWLKEDTLALPASRRASAACRALFVSWQRQQKRSRLERPTVTRPCSWAWENASGRTLTRQTRSGSARLESARSGRWGGAVGPSFLLLFSWIHATRHAVVVFHVVKITLDLRASEGGGGSRGVACVCLREFAGLPFCLYSDQNMKTVFSRIQWVFCFLDKLFHEPLRRKSRRAAEAQRAQRNASHGEMRVFWMLCAAAFNLRPARRWSEVSRHLCFASLYIDRRHCFVSLLASSACGGGGANGCPVVLVCA